MKNCELCPGPDVGLLRSQMVQVLHRNGIDHEHFIQSNPQERLVELINQFKLTDNLDLLPYNPDRIMPFLNGDLGVVVVKPEMYQDSSWVERYLWEVLELEKITTTDFVYLPEQFWAIYGRSFIEEFKDFPHGALLFLVAVTLPSRLIIFRHHSVDRYKDLYKRLNDGASPDELFERRTDDRQFAFSLLFVKSKRNSLRLSVCSEAIENRGFATMGSESPCPSVCWDFTGAFKQRSVRENLKTFNGIHSPRDQAELILNVAVLPKIELS